MKKKREIIIKELAELQRIKLRSKWELTKPFKLFERKGLLGQWASVVWDSRNSVFYVQTNKCIVYPDDVKALKEAIDLMNKANKIIV